MPALNYSLNSPINNNEPTKTKSGLSNIENTKETHIPLLEAEFADLA
jgi:hypothetical protein